jgi:hypothetical protein
MGDGSFIVEKLGIAADLLQIGLSESLFKQDVEDGLHDRVLTVGEIRIQEERILGVLADRDHARSALEGRLDRDVLLDGSQDIDRLA